MNEKELIKLLEKRLELLTKLCNSADESSCYEMQIEFYHRRTEIIALLTTLEYGYFNDYVEEE